MECVVHNGALNSSGYGSVRHNGIRMGAHVRAFILANGTLEDGKVVMHSCDNRSCVNPAHLSSGTQSENIQDAYNKGRMNTTAKSRGEDRHSAKLTELDVLAIRSALTANVYGMASKLARKYGVTPRIISMIKRNELWTSVKS